MAIVIKHAIGSGLILTISLIFFLQTLSYPDSAARLPQILLVLIAVLAVLMFLEAFNRKKQENNEESPAKEELKIKRIIVFGSMIAVYVFLLDVVGYFILTPIFAFSALIYLKATNIIMAMILTISFTLIIYIIFSIFLNVPLPLGTFF